MGLFKHKQKKEDIPSLPELPRLPELPGLPEFHEEYEEKDSIHQLPTFPRSSFGNKFSQDTIKEAVTGEKEGEEGYANDLESFDEVKMMQKPEDKFQKGLRKTPFIKEINENEEFPVSQKIERSPTKKGPIFVRLDKFEESQKIFEETKKELTGISELLNRTKEIKIKEDETLQGWEKELQNIRTQIEKVDRDLFSKV